MTNFPENFSKNTKIAIGIAICKFSKNFRGSMPPNPLEPFLILKLLKINSAKKKTTLEKVTKIVPPL